MIPAPRGDGRGLLYAVLAYGWWGLIALYFKAVSSVPPLEVLAHRVVWSAAFVALLLTGLGRWPAVAGALRSRRQAAWLGASSLLIGLNWFVFIWAVTAGRLLEASLGYFVNPLVSVLLGHLFLRERLRPLEWASVALAAAAVAWLVLGLGTVPVVALVLAVTFGLYGFARKSGAAAPLEGLGIETFLLLLPALAYLGHRAAGGVLALGSRSPAFDALIVASGPVTALPLLWFAAAVRRLRLTSMGLLQYLSPTLQFLLAVLAFREPFDRGRLLAFALIWLALVLFGLDNARAAARRRA